MKLQYPILVAASLLLSSHIAAQSVQKPPGKDTIRTKEDLLKYYLKKFQSTDTFYNCILDKTVRKEDRKPVQFVQPTALDSSFTGIFSTVILNSEDLIKNGNAGAVSQDKDKSTLSFNFSTINKNLNNVFNYGVYGSSTSSIVDIFSKKNWQNAVGVNLGYSRIPTINTRSFDDTACLSVISERNRMVNKKIREYAGIIALNRDSLVRRRDSLYKEDASRNNIAVSQLNTAAIGKKTEDSTVRHYEEVVKQLALYDKLVKGLDSTRAVPAMVYDSIVVAEYTAFDLKISSDKFTGYRVTWWGPTLSIGLAGSKIYNDTLKLNDSITRFHKTDYLRISFGLSWNRSSYQKNKLWYLSLGGRIYNTNFLENRSIAEIPHLVYDTASKKPVIRSEEGSTLGTLNELKQQVWGIAPTAYFAYFFGKQKILGVELNGTYGFLLNRPQEVEMPATFTATVGFLLRVNAKEVLSKGTVGIVFGLINANEHMKVWEEGFGAQLKIGVPFNTIISKAK